MKKIILSVVLVVLLIAGVVTVGVIKSNEAKTPTSTVEMDLNPGATFVVNSKNVVLSVTFANEDADLIYSGIEVVGRNMQEVARDFAQKAIQSGYIDINADLSAGADENCITITISGNEKQAEALKNSLVNKINAVFDENGIFGRAVADIKTQTTNLVEKYADIAAELKLDAQDFANKTEAQVLSIINNQAKKLGGLTSQAIADVETFINSSVITTIQNEIDTWQARIDELQNTLGEFLPSGAKEEINNLKSQIKTKLTEIDKLINNKIAELRQTAKQAFEDLKLELNQIIETNKTALNQHIQNFNDNKDAILAQIQQWRESLSA